MTRHRLIEFAELPSTNRHACAHLGELAHGDVIQAAVQTAGRGREQRAWVSHVPGNLCLSLVLKPGDRPVARLPLVNLSQWLALCVCRVLEAQSVPASLKWPNDLLVRDRKIAGILAETVTAGTEYLGLVLGLGVNLNLDAATLATISQPATSLSVELGRAVPVDVFRDAVLREFFDGYEAFIEQGFPLIREEYLRHCPFIGREVEIRRAEETLRGRAQTVNAAGALELLTADGQTHAVSLGEMFQPAAQS